MLTANERRRKGYRSSWIEIMTLKFGEVRSRRRVGAEPSITRKTVSSGDRHSQKNQEYYKNKSWVVERKRVYEDGRGNSRTRFNLRRNSMSSLPHVLAAAGMCAWPQE